MINYSNNHNIISNKCSVPLLEQHKTDKNVVIFISVLTAQCLFSICYSIRHYNNNADLITFIKHALTDSMYKAHNITHKLYLKIKFTWNIFEGGIVTWSHYCKSHAIQCNCTAL
jgi:hypothetical protein